MSQSIFINGISDVDSPFEQIEYLPDGTMVANTASPYMIYHIDTAGNVLSAWNGLGFTLSADKTIMAHDSEGSIVLVEIASNVPLLSLEDASAMAFSFSPDGSRIAAENIGVDYIRTLIWDIPNKTLLTSLEESANPRFSPDSRFLAVTMYDYENDKTPLKIFRPDGATEVMTLNVSEPDDLSNRAALWSADGSVVAAQIANGPPFAWDTTNWQPLDSSALQGELYSFSPDGSLLITRTADGGILLWGVMPYESVS
jgi:WD40 repeat protein